MAMTAVRQQQIDHVPAAVNVPDHIRTRECLLRMAEAANEVVDCIGELHAAGSNVVLEALRNGGEFTEWEHYPADDARDPVTHGQYYLHAHSPDDREQPDYAHFHVFMGQGGLPDHLRGNCRPDGDRPVHLVAISMTPDGMPARLFTTNRWVTDESWHGAADVIALLDRFAMTEDQPSRPLNRWLTAMIKLFRPQIEDLLWGRDRTIALWRAREPGADVLENRTLDITSSMSISLMQQIGWLEQQLDG